MYMVWATKDDVRLKALNEHSLESRRIRAELIRLCYKMQHVDFFKLADSSVTRGHQFKLCKPLCPSVFIASTFWYRVVINTWNVLSANIVSATSVAMFKARLNDLDLSKFAVLF